MRIHRSCFTSKRMQKLATFLKMLIAANEIHRITDLSAWTEQTDKSVFFFSLLAFLRTSLLQEDLSVWLTGKVTAATLERFVQRNQKSVATYPSCDFKCGTIRSSIDNDRSTTFQAHKRERERSSIIWTMFQSKKVFDPVFKQWYGSFEKK